MTRNPSLKDIWLREWGTMPDFADKMPAEFDTSIPPGLWPNDDHLENVRAVAIFNGTTWLSLVKSLTPEALSETQMLALRTVGFRQGQNGRLIHPSYPNPELVATVGKILGCELEPLTQEQVVNLQTDEQFKPKIPLDVQAAIRQLWVNDKAGLVEEIFESLKESESLPEDIEKHINRGDTDAPLWLKNPVRLQVWVSQALAGEITATTEPIIALGLAQIARTYGSDPFDWPDDCQSLRRDLLEYRGIDATELEQSESLVDTGTDTRPQLQSPVAWEQDGQVHTGVVIGLPAEPEELWVTPSGDSIEAHQKMRSGIPFYVPVRLKIRTADLVGEHAPVTPADNVAEDVTPEPASQVAQIDEESLAPQPRLTPSMLLNRGLARKAPFGVLSHRLQQRVNHVARAGSTRGMIYQHPLTMLADTPSHDFVGSWGRLDTTFLGENGSFDEINSDAEIVLRDSLLEQFNEAQPSTQDGKPALLAVLPYGHQMEDAPMDDPDTLKKLDALQYNRVGIHPRLIPQINEAMAQWLEDTAPELAKEHPEMQSRLQTIAFNFVSQMGLSFDTLSLGSATTSRQLFRQQFIQRERRFADAFEPTSADSVEANQERISAWLDHLLSEEGQREFREEFAGIYTSYEEAGRFINGQAPERVAHLADKNRRLIAAAADIAGVAPNAIVNSAHPIHGVLEVLEKNGLESADRAETMARVGLDLSRNVQWLGQMMVLQGASLDMVHRSQLVEEADAVTEQNARDHGEMDRIRATVRMEAFSGFLNRNGERLPFQLGILDEQESLFETSRQNLRKNSIALISTDEIAQSLGRLADIHHIAPLNIGEPLEQNGQLIRPEAIDALKPSIVGSAEFAGNSRAVLDSQRLGLTAFDQAHPVNELIQHGNTTTGDISRFMQKNREVLLTGTPSFSKNERMSKEVFDALGMFVQDFKPFKGLTRPERTTESLMRDLVQTPNPEMLVVVAKATRSRVRWLSRVVTREDLEEAGFDRRSAGELGLMKIKSKYPDASKTWRHYEVLDLANALRPEAMRYLNEIAKQQDRKAQDTDSDEPKERKVRGARQDRGKVAGLAIKDLRGSRSTVLKKLSNASAEEQGKFITKTKLWEAPDWSFLRAPSEEDRNEGARPMEPMVAYFFHELRKNIAAAPPANLPDVNQMYARFVLGIRDAFDWIRTESELVSALKVGGDIYELAESIRERAEAQGWRYSLIVGEDVTFRSYFNDDRETILQRDLDRARRKTRQNKEWAIKEAKPGVGRKPAISTNLETDADDVEQGLTGAMPMLSRLVRASGEDYRGGTDITEETVIQTFGFSGIEYGKSMNQADRTAYLNHAYDSFLDMSKLLNVPPKALSLGGTLGLAFGSRGRGGRRAAAAHFEPMNNAINLTRMNGAGSMGHEYGHALANYFFRISRGLQGSRAPGDITRVLNQQANRNQEVSAGQLREPVAQAIGAVLRSLKYTKPEEDQSYRGMDSLFYKGAFNADIMDGRDMREPYWSSIEEMFARAFETYISVALKEKFPDFRNDFLVREDKLATWGDKPYEARKTGQKALDESREKYGRFISEVRKNVERELGETEEADEAVRQIMKERQMAESIMRQPILYPGGEERENMKNAFNTLFETLKTKDVEVQHEHLGRQTMPVLYSSASGLAERIGQRDHEAIAACVMEEVARMCGDNVLLQWRDEIRTEEGELAAGRYTPKKRASEMVKGVIEMAMNAGLHTAHHEAFHFAQDNLLLKEEQSMLDRFFAPESELMNRLEQTLVEQGRQDALAVVRDNPREAQAYAYEEWVKGNLDMKVDVAPAGVFGRINSLFTRAAGLTTNTGFQTPEQVFQAFYSGLLRDRAEAKAASAPKSNNSHGKVAEPVNHADALHGNFDGDYDDDYSLHSAVRA